MSDLISLQVPGSPGSTKQSVRTRAVQAALEVMRAQCLGGGTNGSGLEDRFKKLGVFADAIEAALVVKE